MASPAPQSIPGFSTREQHEAMAALLADMRYPVGPQGEVLQLMEAWAGILAYHLARAGWRPVIDKRLIKARRPYGGGMFEDAVQWVDISEPDDPLANWSQISPAEAERLPEDQRLEWRRRAGLPVPAPQQPEGWHTTTRIHITDGPDPDDEEQP